MTGWDLCVTTMLQLRGVGPSLHQERGEVTMARAREQISKIVPRVPLAQLEPKGNTRTYYRHLTSVNSLHTLIHEIPPNALPPVRLGPRHGDIGATQDYSQATPIIKTPCHAYQSYQIGVAGEPFLGWAM